MTDGGRLPSPARQALDPRFARALTMERAMHAAAAAAVTAVPWGEVLLRPQLPAIHVENFGWVDDPEAGALEVHAALDDVLGGAGIEHRVAAGVAGRWCDALAQDGWAVEPEPFLALAGRPDRVDPGPARQAGLEEVLPGIERWHAESLGWAADPAVRAQAVEHHRTYGSAGARETCFAVFEDDVAVAWAKLWRRDGVAQVEDVVVRSAWRGRGHGRHVVTAAVQAARDAELCFIVAAEHDWPVELYRRLGFEDVGRFAAAVQAPPPGTYGTAGDADRRTA